MFTEPSMRGAPSAVAGRPRTRWSIRRRHDRVTPRRGASGGGVRRLTSSALANTIAPMWGRDAAHRRSARPCMLAVGIAAAVALAAHLAHANGSDFPAKIALH